MVTLKKPTIKISQGIRRDVDDSDEEYEQTINKTFKDVEKANTVFPGTITGLIFSNYYVKHADEARRIYESIDKHRERAKSLNLEVGIRLNICQMVISPEYFSSLM